MNKKCLSFDRHPSHLGESCVKNGGRPRGARPTAKRPSLLLALHCRQQQRTSLFLHPWPPSTIPCLALRCLALPRCATPCPAMPCLAKHCLDHNSKNLGVLPRRLIGTQVLNP